MQEEGIGQQDFDETDIFKMSGENTGLKDHKIKTNKQSTNTDFYAESF